jgi:hypothetical protein
VPAAGTVKVRVYPMGEDDNAAVGQPSFGTVDIQESPTEDFLGRPIQDSGGFFVPLDVLSPEQSPQYVEGRAGGNSLALHFDGVDDTMQAVPFDPRDFWGDRQQFNALSQGWVKPDAAGQGTRQMVWQLGPDNGSVAITDTGFWELIPGGNAAPFVTPSAVEFDEWTHIAILRTGNDGRLYLNGSLVGSSGGFWNVTGTQVVGSDTAGAQNFRGTIDDFNISGFSDAMFNPAVDIDFFEGLLSGVPGDIDQDGDVNELDYQAWSMNVGFNNNLGAGDPFTLLRGDLDANGRVNYFDLQLLIGFAEANGTPLPPWVVPEPTGTVLLMLGVLSLVGFRRRR